MSEVDRYSVERRCVCTERDRSGGWGCCCSQPAHVVEDPEGEFVLAPGESGASSGRLGGAQVGSDDEHSPVSESDPAGYLTVAAARRDGLDAAVVQAGDQRRDARVTPDTWLDGDHGGLAGRDEQGDSGGYEAGSGAEYGGPTTSSEDDSEI